MMKCGCNKPWWDCRPGWSACCSKARSLIWCITFYHVASLCYTSGLPCCIWNLCIIFGKCLDDGLIGAIFCQGKAKRTHGRAKFVKWFTMACWCMCITYVGYGCMYANLGHCYECRIQFVMLASLVLQQVHGILLIP